MATLGTLGDIRNKVAAYFARKVEDFQPEIDGNAGKIDVIYEALDAARLSAEQQHAFEQNKKVLSATVNGATGLDLSSPLTEYGTANSFIVRSVKTVYRQYGSKWVEIPFEYRQNLQFPPQEYCSPSELQFTTSNAISRFEKVFIVGSKLFHYPLSDENIPILLDAYTWMVSYASGFDTPTDQKNWTDWMTQFGSNYLFWAALEEVNFIENKYVFRQEGNIVIPQNKVQTELQKLKVWDSQWINSQSSLLDE
jgi:hypothetical protein